MAHEFFKLESLVPANTTSCLQPLDAGIIKMFKLHFRKQLLKHVVARIDSCTSATELTKQLNVLHAVNWIARSWHTVPATTITKCFTACGFQWPGYTQPSEDSCEDVQAELCELNGTASSLGMSVDMDVEEYVVAESGVPTESIEGWEEALVQEYRETLQGSSNSMGDVEERDDSDEEDATVLQEISPHEALTYLGKLQQFFSHHDADNVVLVDRLLQSVEHGIIVQKQASLKQSSLDDYFKV